MLSEVVKMLESVGWAGLFAYVAFLTYKTSTVGLVALAVYKAIKLIVSSRASRTLEERIAAEMGTVTPLSPGEESRILAKVRELKSS